MGVIIENMEIPSHCLECKFMVSRDGDDCILQSEEANASFETWDDMKANCPLKEYANAKWVRVYGFATPGGDPVWACSNCGKGLHVYGVEHGTYGADIADKQWVSCPNCGANMRGKNE